MENKKMSDCPNTDKLLKRFCTRFLQIYLILRMRFYFFLLFLFIMFLFLFGVLSVTFSAYIVSLISICILIRVYVFTKYTLSFASRVEVSDLDFAKSIFKEEEVNDQLVSFVHVTRQCLGEFYGINPNIICRSDAFFSLALVNYKNPRRIDFLNKIKDRYEKTSFAMMAIERYLKFNNKLYTVGEMFVFMHHKSI